MLNKLLIALWGLCMITPVISQAQLLNKLEKVVKEKTGSSLSNEDATAGLKEALKTGINNGATRLSKTDGYFKNSSIKILMPPDAVKVEEKLRAMGLGSKVDEAIESMNRGAEKAAIKSIPIFSDAITNMTVTDALGIVKGGNNAATNYLKSSTGNSLQTAFKPTIKEALDQVGATKHWTEVFDTYNKIPFVKKVNPDLVDYVTQKAVEGLFVQVALEEAKIRTDPAAQVTDLLKKVFGK